MKKIVCGLLLSIGLISSGLIAPTAHADTNYQVEIIVFARDMADGEDSLRSSRELRYPAKTVVLSSGGGDPAPFQLLPASSLQLNREASAIEQRKNMHVLLHQAWLWPSEDAAHATAVAISAGRAFGNHRELEGYIALSAEHFLRIDTRLWLSRFSSDATINIQTAGNTQTSSDALLLPVASTSSESVLTGGERNADNYIVNQLFLLREQRRMRSSELHYFDHSRLGLLVQVTPIVAAP